MFGFGLKAEITALKVKAENDLQDLERHFATLVTSLESRVKELEGIVKALSTPSQPPPVQPNAEKETPKV